MRIRNWTHWSALCGLGSLALCSSASAQTTSAQDASAMSIVDTPSVATAPSHYSVNGTFRTEYQTNVAGGGAAISALRGLKQEDYIFTPSLLISAFKPLGRESVFLTGSAGYNIYDRNSKLNRESFDLTGGVNGRLSICRATVSGGYIRRQNEIQDVTRTSVPDTYEQTTVGLEGACGQPIGFSPTFSINQTWSNNGLAQLQSSNYNTLGGSGGISYQAPTFGNLSLFGQYQTTDFTNRTLFVGLQPVHDGFDSYGGGLRYVRQLGARIQGTVSVSYTKVKPFVGSSGFSGLTYGADVTFRASSRLTFHGSVNRDVQPSNVFDSTYYLETKGLVEAHYNLGSKLVVNLGVSELDRDFKGPSIVKMIDLRSDSLKSIFGSVTYSLRKVYLTLDLRNDQRESNVAGLGYPDTRVGLTAGTRF